MSEQNPLRIFTDEQLDGIYPGKLKRLKKEILLEFQLTDTPTIELNGIEIDKNGVLELFADLEENLTTYLFIQNQKNLTDFLEGKNELLLLDAKALDAIKNDTARAVIEQKIGARLKQLILKHVADFNAKTTSKLTSIDTFVQRLNPALEDEVYSDAYAYIKDHIAFLEEQFESPFSSPDNHRFHFELGRNINSGYYELLKSLPAGFSGLARQYAIWCNNIVYGATQRFQQFRKFARTDLLTLCNAAKIAANEYNREGNLRIAKTIQSYLNNNGARKSSGSGSLSGWSIFVILLVVVKLIFNIHRCSNNSGNRYTQSNSSQTYQQKELQSELRRILAEAEKKQGIRKNYTKKSSSTNAYELNFQGEKKQSVNAQLIREKDFDSYSEMMFNVDALPSKTTFFNRLLPPRWIDKHKGKVWPVVMKFKHPKIKNSTLTHRVRFDLRDNRSIPQQDYAYKESEYGEDLNLSLKSIASSSFPLKGVLSRVNPKTNEVLHSLSFTINRDKNKEYLVRLGNHGQRFKITKEDMDRVESLVETEMKDKFVIALKNMKMINRKYLKQGNFYSMENVLGYYVEKSEGRSYPTGYRFKETAYLKYYITSDEDDTAYVQMKGQKVSMKFFADFSSGRIKGMSMVNANSMGDEIERLTLFGSK